YLAVGNLPKNYSFKITKVNDKGAKLEGAEFTLYSDKECKNVIKTVKTNREGIVLFENLIPEVRYYYKETNPAKGYKLPKDNKVNEVYATAVPVRDQFTLFINGVGHISNTQDNSVTIEGNKENRVGGVTIVNEIQMKLPETGSNLMFLIIIVGAFFICAALFLSHKSKVKNLKVK
ncbi:prealbumin-like fold domain-containing protein, partial [uncultured Clostridium sp.]|uniref:prealbumin-like fold domain-containing protein n=1 Tax=uncultured Clostridium sp. TaxID=59620 RepID=UPI00280A84AC